MTSDLIPLADLGTCTWVVGYVRNAVTGDYLRCGKAAVAYHVSARKGICQGHAEAVRRAEQEAERRGWYRPA